MRKIIACFFIFGVQGVFAGDSINASSSKDFYTSCTNSFSKLKAGNANIVELMEAGYCSGIVDASLEGAYLIYSTKQKTSDEEQINKIKCASAYKSQLMRNDFLETIEAMSKGSFFNSKLDFTSSFASNMYFLGEFNDICGRDR